MSPCFAFVTDHQARIRPDYCMSSVMDSSEGQEGLIQMNCSLRSVCRSWVSQIRIWILVFLLCVYSSDGLEIALCAIKCCQMEMYYSSLSKVCKGSYL